MTFKNQIKLLLRPLFPKQHQTCLLLQYRKLTQLQPQSKIFSNLNLKTAKTQTLIKMSKKVKMEIIICKKS